MEDPIFKDANKNGVLDGAEVLAALKSKNKATKANARFVLAEAKDVADEFNEAMQAYKKQYPKGDIYKDTQFKAKLDSITEYWEKAIAKGIDAKSFPQGVDLTNDDTLNILKEFGAKLPTRQR